MSLQERFTAVGEIRNIFDVLFSFSDMANAELEQQCEALSSALSHGGQADVDGKQLTQELTNVQDLPTTSRTLMEVLDFCTKRDCKRSIQTCGWHSEQQQQFLLLWQQQRGVFEIQAQILHGARAFEWTICDQY